MTAPLDAFVCVRVSRLGRGRAEGKGISARPRGWAATLSADESRHGARAGDTSPCVRDHF